EGRSRCPRNERRRQSPECTQAIWWAGETPSTGVVLDAIDRDVTVGGDGMQRARRIEARERIGPAMRELFAMDDDVPDAEPAEHRDRFVIGEEREIDASLQIALRQEAA